MQTKTYTNILCILLVVCIAGFVSDVWAAKTGKITGQIMDQGSNEPLAGANIVLQGTGMGAAADLDGFFIILNVPPGAYTVEVSMIGYASYIQENVQVSVNQTTTLDIGLST